MTQEEMKRDQLEGNLRRLFGRLEEDGDMTSDTRAEILSRLQDEASAAASRPRESRAVRHGWLRWASAAAALLVAGGLLLWPSSRNVTWAAVARQISEARTLVAQTTTEVLHGGKSRVIFRSRLYYKDPGMSRTEIFGNPREDMTGDPDRIEILVRKPRSATELRLYPVEQRGERKVYAFAEGAAQRVTLNLVAEAWTRLSDVAQSAARPIGERTIAGVKAVGFAVPADALFGKTSVARPDTTLKVWATPKAGVPVALIIETPLERTTVDRMRWNEPLADDLFDLQGPHGWTVETRQAAVTATGLPAEAPSVSFAIHLLAGTPASADSLKSGQRLLPKRYVSNSDVESASVVPDGASCAIQVQMTPAGTKKLALLTREHFGEQLAMVIDGRVEMAPTIRSVIDDGLVKVTGRFTQADCQQIVSGLMGAR